MIVYHVGFPYERITQVDSGVEGAGQVYLEDFVGEFPPARDYLRDVDLGLFHRKIYRHGLGLHPTYVKISIVMR